MKKIALIIVNYNTYDLTIKCVNSILKNCNVNYDIILVDNKSANNSFDILKKEFMNVQNIKIVQAPINRGYSAGLNYGLNICEFSKYEFFGFLNNDLYFDKGVIENLLETFEKYNDVGVVGGKIINSDGVCQKSYKYLLNFRKQLMETKPFSFFVKNEEAEDGYDYKKTLVFDGMVAGCCFIISSPVIKKINKLDEEIFIYYEEDALGHRIHNMNLKCALNPKAEIIHLGSQTISRSAFTYYQRYRSALYVLAKYCGASKNEIRILYIIYRLSFFIKFKYGEEYRKYYDEIGKYYKKIIDEVYK